ncbi:hypothetical protein [Arthrobacter sp. R-11]|uniref:hypothetical protein n=1 Tax=Arthrobacter sp. R-11 TaxID=3404053 RepID=UPI003CF044DA
MDLKDLGPLFISILALAVGIWNAWRLHKMDKRDAVKLGVEVGKDGKSLIISNAGTTFANIRELHLNSGFGETTVLDFPSTVESNGREVLQLSKALSPHPRITIVYIVGNIAVGGRKHEKFSTQLSYDPAND